MRVGKDNIRLVIALEFIMQTALILNVHMYI